MPWYLAFILNATTSPEETEKEASDVRVSVLQAPYSALYT